MSDESQDAWVKRVLGIDLSGAAATAPAGRLPPEDLLVLFRDAKEDVDAGLSRLQAELRATGDEDLIRIADYGMFGMTNGEGVGLMKALLELKGAPPERREAASQAARNAAVAYKAAVFGHKLADLVDDNPFGVEVRLKATLGRALDIIARAA